jgi:hypothetical protein
MKCEFIKPDGQKCEAYAVKDSEFCYFHNPDIDDEEKREAQSNGGKTKALTLKEALPPLALGKPSDAVLLIADTISRVRAGTLDIRTANCLGFLSDKLLKAFEVSQLNDRVEVIERVILERKTKKY